MTFSEENVEGINQVAGLGTHLTGSRLVGMSHLIITQCMTESEPDFRCWLVSLGDERYDVSVLSEKRRESRLN
jgi:hypothetical protein